MKPLPALFIISVLLFSTFSVAVADSNETISIPSLEMPSLSISDYVNKVLVEIKKWRFDSSGLIETNTGIFVNERFWEWVEGSIQETANLTDTALKWAEVFNEKVRNDEPVQWIFITWTKPNDRLKEALEALGADVIYIDEDINAISLKAKPSLIKNLVYSQAFLIIDSTSAKFGQTFT